MLHLCYAAIKKDKFGQNMYKDFSVSRGRLVKPDKCPCVMPFELMSAETRTRNLKMIKKKNPTCRCEVRKKQVHHTSVAAAPQRLY